MIVIAVILMLQPFVVALHLAQPAPDRPMWQRERLVRRSYSAAWLGTGILLITMLYRAATGT